MPGSSVNSRQEITPEELMGRGTAKSGLQSQSSISLACFTPRRPEPAPEGSQTVPLPPRFPPATEGSMLYGYELVPSLFGPGEIVARFRDHSTMTFNQPTSIREAIDAFQFVAGASGLLHGVEILQYRIPPIACFATAQEEFGIRSALNYDKAMLSDSQIQQLTNDLHLTKPPEWIFKPSPVTPEWKANFQAENANVQSIFAL
ncbi:hypothetical protein B0H11DRAFT_513751 [Mycena galericulata]|nr:hypothetical protein B0H11DRAFT_513751 [Mycena galericulata]